VYDKSTTGTGHFQRQNFETFIEYLPRPRQLGGVPPSVGVPPPISPARAADNMVGETAVV
jgi:hypothetical protein